MRATIRQTKALALLTLRYWARAGVPNRLRKDQGRRASGAVLRGAFLLLMTNWGYRIGVACVRVEPEHRTDAVAWMLVGLVSLSITWGAMGRGPGMRAPRSVLTSPLLDALPLREGSRVLIGLVERITLYALAIAALFAVARTPRIELLLLGLALPTAGLLTGDAALRLLRTVVSPIRMGRIAVVVLVMQFPSFMIVGGAPMLARVPRTASLVRPLQPYVSALLENGSMLAALGACLALGLTAAVLIRTAERTGYDRIDIVPTQKIANARPSELDLVGIEGVLAKREPGGRWLVRGGFFYTAVASGSLVAVSYLSKTFPADSASTLVRSLGYVAIFSGFAVVQTRATRMVVRDASARAMLAPLPIAPRDLLRGKTRALMLQALFVVSPYFVLLAMPGSLSLHAEILWRGSAAVAALVFAAAATVAVAFLTQGLGGVKVLGGSLGLETTLVAMPLLGVAASPYLWSAIVSVASLAMLAHEANRSALRCLRWVDDADEHEGETVVWRALLVFASFQAAQTIGRRLLAFAPLDDNAQAASAYAFAGLALLGLTLYGRRGLPPLRVLPSARAPAWLVLGLVGGVAAGSLNVGYRYLLRGIGVSFPSGAMDTDPRIAIVALTVVLAPIVEEIFFRGWLQSAIEGELSARRRWLAPVLGAFAFAAVRPPLAFAPTLVLGAVCGILYARSRSLAPSVLAHATCFAVSFAAHFGFGAGVGAP